MIKYRALARILVYIYILAIISSGASAQELPGRVANTGITGASSMTTAQSMFDGTEDVLFGKNAKGPYTLSWKPIDRNSESVTINNHRVERNADYQIDYNSGVLAFTSPVPSGAVIRIGYQFDPKKATKNVSAINMPLSLDLLKRDSGSLKFNALYRQAGADPKQPTDMMLLGLSGDTTIKGGQLSSMFMFTPDTKNQEGVDASFIDRAAMQLGGTTDVGALNLTTSYSRVGEYFAGAKEYKLKPGLEVMDLGASYKPSDILNLTASTKRTEELAGAKEGEVTTTNTYAVAYTDGKAPKLNVSRTEVEKDRPDADALKTTTDTVKLDHQLSANVSASALHENVTSEVGDEESRVTTNQLSVNAKVSENTNVNTNVTQKDSTAAGNETLAKVNIDMDPSAKLTIKAAVTSLNTDAKGKDLGETIKVIAKPSDILNIEVNAAHRETDESGRDATESMKLTAKPSGKLSVELNVGHRDSEADGSELGHSLKVVSSPLSYLNLTVDWAARESEIRGDEQVGKFWMQATPSKMLSVTAAIGMHGTDAARNVTREARLKLDPFSHTSISGGYSEVETDGAVVAKVTDVSASTNPSKFVKFDGAYKQREQIGQDDLNSVKVGVVLDSGGLFKLTGDYINNPEDKKGVVQRENNRKIGLLTDFGRLKVRGGFTMKDNYLAGKRSEVTEVGMDYQLSSYAQLTTSYKLDEYREQSVLSTNVYALGYKHRVGSDFSLYLGGSMTTYEENRMFMEGKTEYEAQANLGLRF